LLQAENPVELTPLNADHYQHQIFSVIEAFGSQKYMGLSKLVKAALTLSHGKIDLERDFLLSRILLSLDRTSMPERVLNAKLYVIDQLNIYGGKPERFPIPKELFTLPRLAWSKYQDYVDSKAKQKAAERSFQDKEKERELDLVDILGKKALDRLEKSLREK